MTQELPKGKKIQFALALAQGKSVGLWARENQVAKSTAYRWATDPDVQSTVEFCRRRFRESAMIRMARRARWASDQIALLAENADSESVRFRALRSIISDAVAVPKLSDIEYRVAELEQILGDRIDDTDRPSTPVDIRWQDLETRPDILN
jgi:hypothetical protein